MGVADGYIAKPEMEQMLTAVYRVMFQARPSYAAAIDSDDKRTHHSITKGIASANAIDACCSGYINQQLCW